VDSRPPSTQSAFSEVSSIEPQQIWDGVLGRVVRGEQVTVGVIELDPGSFVPEHRHPNEQVGVLLRGSLIFRVGAESRELGPGGAWSIPADVPHDVRVGPEGAIVVEAFAPIRADWEQLERLEPRRPLWPDPA
jgi:quercetin dioxygenase-like cupin family protein